MAENMEVESMGSNVTFTDIHMDENSVKPSTQIKDSITIGEITSLGVIPVPIIDTIEELIRQLEIHQDDTRFIMAMIRESTINFSHLQRDLIEKIEQEYSAWIDPNNTDANVFDIYVTELKEDLLQLESVNEEFFEEQKNQYLCVYKALTRYPFPYSEKQLELLESFKEGIDWAYGDPTQMADIALLEDLQLFLGLMEKGDHANNDRFYVNCTVEYYVQQMIDELFYPVHEEITRSIPGFIHGGTLVNIATYVRDELSMSFARCLFESHCDLYDMGLAEIYNRLVDIFKLSGLPFSELQSKLISNILRDIGKVLKDPTIWKYEDLHLGFYGFIDALRRDHPDIEMKEEDGFMVINQEGDVAKIVEKIRTDLNELRKEAAHHHDSFSEYSYSIPEITTNIIQHFTRIYPPGISKPITYVRPDGSTASIVLKDWFNDQ